ncbi:MAG: hypothetical protein DCC55_05555 [Chloroflexi bacterium]|nr:MAG: hypothetical protein DCC55_05555 [Chloroflexota bacterium]
MFQVLSWLIALPCLFKGALALIQADRFYRWRSEQYAADSVPVTVLIMPLYVVSLATASWWATLTGSHPWGWIVTGFSTLIALLGILNLSRWHAHSRHVGKLIATQPKERTKVDLFLLGLGILFAALAIFVY